MIDAILILGMHRSGTSCLTGCLKNMGLNLGEVSGRNAFNLKGNQENKNVFRLNEALFIYNNGSWKNPPNPTLLKSNSELEHRRSQVLAAYSQLPKPWGIKDPRMLMAYEFWQNNLPAHQFVGTLRHPTAVVNSLFARNKINKIDGYNLWERYNKQLLNFYNQTTFPIANFDESKQTYVDKIYVLAERLKLNVNLNLDFFDASLKHQTNYKLSDCPAHLLPLYKKILDRCI